LNSYGKYKEEFGTGNEDGGESRNYIILVIKDIWYYKQKKQS